MNNEIPRFLEEFKRIVDRNRKFLYYTRGIEFQKDSVTELETFKKKLVVLKEEMIEIKDEESANLMLSLEYLLDAYINDFKMLIFLKEDKMDKAWESLIKAQYSLRSSIQAHDVASNFDVENHLQKLLLIEKIFFPPFVFMSIAGTVESSKCSICNEEYGKCNHVKGKAYMGKLCHRVITKFKEFKDVSLVDNPGNKLCRITIFFDKGFPRNIMTWRINQKKNKNEEVHPHE